MRRIVKTPYKSLRIGSPPKGCRACVKGAKLVLLATGVCRVGCWYCPLSTRKKGKDVIVANEWWVRKDEDIIEEARLTQAEGAGITGGDPLCRLGRTIHYIRLLKRKFGRKFHIHLYTPGGLATPETLKKLCRAGLDEIRFHPDFLNGGKTDISAIKAALGFDWSVGVEIPVIPGRVRQTKEFIRLIDDAGADFLNLNQFEISETNAAAMAHKGFEAESDASFAVKGSAKAAKALLDYCAKHTKLRVHYCTVRLKDGVQLRNRLKRRAKNAAKESDIITEDGLLIRGAIYLPESLPSFDYHRMLERMPNAKKTRMAKTLRLAALKIRRKFNIPSTLIAVERERLRILTGAWIVEEIAGELKDMGLRPAVVEEYPTWDALITDLTTL